MHRRWRSLAALTIARAAMGFQFQTVAALAPLLQRDLALDKTQLGWLIGLYLLPGAAVALPGGLLGKRFGDSRVVIAGLALMAAGGLGLAAAQSFAQANAARLVSGIGAVMLNVLVTKMVADVFDGKERLLAMSILINSWPIGIGLALLVVGPLGAHAGWPWGFAASTLFALIGCVLVAAMHRAPRDAVGAPAWLDAQLHARPTPTVVRNLAVRELGDVAVGNVFLDRAATHGSATATLYVVDVWRQADGRLTARYEAQPTHPVAAPTRPRGRE